MAVIKTDLFDNPSTVNLVDHTSDSGGGWQGDHVSLGIVGSSGVVDSIGTGTTANIGDEDPTETDYFVEASGRIGGTAGTDRWGVVARGQDGVDFNPTSSSYYFFRLQGDSGWSLFRVDSGIPAAELAGDASYIADESIGTATVVKLKLQVEGTGATVTLNAWIDPDGNGYQQVAIDVEDTNANRIVAAGNVGLYGQQTNFTVLDLNAEDLTGAGAGAEFDGTPTATATTDGYELDFTITNENETVSAVAVPVGQTAPTSTQIHAGNGTGDVAALVADSTAATADVADQLVLTGLDFPDHDVYIAVLAEVVAFTNERKLPIAGLQYVTIDVPWPGGADSILDGASPAVVDGDIIECSANTNPGGYALTMDADGTFSFDPEDDESRQRFDARFYDVSIEDWSDDPAVKIYIDNIPPDFIADPQDLIFHKDVAITSIDLRDRWNDSEDDPLTVTFQDTLPTGLSVDDSVLSGTPEAASSAANYTERATDITGDFTEEETEITVLDTATMPDVDDGDVTEATAIASITGAGLQSPNVSYAIDEGVTIGNVISQSPAAGVIHPLSFSTSIVVSALSVAVNMKSDVGFRIVRNIAFVPTNIRPVKF